MNIHDDTFMNSAVRGFVNNEGNIYFYVGYDFIVTPEIEQLFFDHLVELAQKLELKPTAKIYGGLIRQSTGGQWPPAKEYGCVAELIS